MRITDRVTLLEAKGDRMAVNPVILSDDNITIMVDTSIPGALPDILAAMQENSIHPESINRLIFTHQDMDHIGSARDVKDLAPHLITMSHPEEAPYTDGSKTPIKMAARLAAMNTLPAEEQQRLRDSQATAAKCSITIDDYIQDGQVLPYCGGITVIHTPGHTPGHICLLCEGILIAGDALNAGSGELRGPNPVHTYDMALAMASVKKLMQYPIKAVCCFHGGLFEGDVQAALAAIVAGT